MRKRIFQSYFFSELFSNFFAILLVLFLIVLGRQFVHFLERVTEGYYSQELFFPLLFFGSFGSLLLAVPLASTLAIVLVFGRFHQDNELCGFFNAGIGYREIYSGLSRFLIPLVLLAAVLSLEVLPSFRMQYETLKAEAKEYVDFSVISPGKFFTFPGGMVFFAENRGDGGEAGELVNIFFAEKNKKTNVVETASRGIFSLGKNDEKIFYLWDGERYEREKSGELTKAMHYRMRELSFPPQETATGIYSPRTMSFSSLLGESSLAAEAELQRRLSLPILIVMLALLVVPLCTRRTSSYQYGNVLPTLLIFIICLGTTLLIVKWVKEGLWPVFPGVWLLHGLLLLVALLTGWTSLSASRPWIGLWRSKR